MLLRTVMIFFFCLMEMVGEYHLTNTPYALTLCKDKLELKCWCEIPCRVAENKKTAQLQFKA